MPSVQFTGSFNGVAGSDGLTTIATGNPVPYGAVITNVSYSLRITATGYSSSESWILDQIAIGGKGGTPSAYGSAAMHDNEHTFSGNMNWLASDVGKFRENAINVYAAAYTTHSSKSFLWEFVITVDYAIPTECIKPSTVTINGSANTVATNATTATLAWSGAEAGTASRIRAYLIYSYDSTDGGNTWNERQVVNEVETSATSGSIMVAIPDVGTRRKFSVVTCSSLGSIYDSQEAESPMVYRKERPSPTAYTDSIIEAGTTRVKAAHMLELQNDINALREYNGLSAYTFSEIRAGYTSLAGWNEHIEEMRTAIDAISADHEEWLPLGDNAPRAEVVMQVRRVVAIV